MSRLHSLVTWGEQSKVTCETWFRPASLFLLPSTWARYELCLDDVLEVVKRFTLEHLLQLMMFYFHDSFDVEKAQSVSKRNLVEILQRLVPYTPKPSQLCLSRSDHVPNLPLLFVPKTEFRAIVKLVPILRPTLRNKIVYASAWTFKDALYVPIEWNNGDLMVLMHRVLREHEDTKQNVPVNAPIFIQLDSTKYVVTEEAVFVQRAPKSHKRRKKE